MRWARPAHLPAPRPLAVALPALRQLLSPGTAFTFTWQPTFDKDNALRPGSRVNDTRDAAPTGPGAEPWGCGC